jgi:hypothetical protein
MLSVLFGLLWPLFGSFVLLAWRESKSIVQLDPSNLSATEVDRLSRVLSI